MRVISKLTNLFGIEYSNYVVRKSPVRDEYQSVTIWLTPSIMLWLDGERYKSYAICFAWFSWRIEVFFKKSREEA